MPREMLRKKNADRIFYKLTWKDQDDGNVQLFMSILIARLDTSVQSNDQNAALRFDEKWHTLVIIPRKDFALKHPLQSIVTHADDEVTFDVSSVSVNHSWPFEMVLHFSRISNALQQIFVICAPTSVTKYFPLFRKRRGLLFITQ